MPLDSARSAGSNVNAYLLMEDTVLGFGMRVNTERWVDGSCIIAFRNNCGTGEESRYVVNEDE